MDLLLIAMQEMDREIKEKRREWEKQGDREDQIDRSNYLDGFHHAWKIANRVHNKGAKNTEQPTSEEEYVKEADFTGTTIAQQIKPEEDIDQLDSFRAALRECVALLDESHGYVTTNWIRNRADYVAQVENAIANARKALGEE